MRLAATASGWRAGLLLVGSRRMSSIRQALRCHASASGLPRALHRPRHAQPVAQIWVADITYVHLAKAFAYLAVILDAFSRKAVGWAFDNTLDASLAIAALEKAIAVRRPTRGSLIHHSDRGVQYASIAYRQRLADREIAVSMSRPGNPFDNAKAESFMKTLKAEEINGKAFADLSDARRRINGFIAEGYNDDRLHSVV